MMAWEKQWKMTQVTGLQHEPSVESLGQPWLLRLSRGLNQQMEDMSKSFFFFLSEVKGRHCGTTR